MKILVVDDEKLLVKGIKFNLENEGYAVDACYDGQTAVQMASAGDYGLIILDLMLPGEDGFEILRDLQSNTLYSDIPVIIVSAKNGESDKVKGLEMGASDYMDKPFGVMELLARCKANIRKSGAQSASFKGLSYDAGKQRFLLNGSPMQLTNKEMEILKALFDHHGNLVKKDDLLHLVWPDAVDVETRTVDVHISMIRRKLAPYGIAISTVRGMGYILE